MPIPTQNESTPSKSVQALPEKGRSLATAAGSISVATMISRVLAMGREMVMSKYFGAGYYTDAFNAAFRVPNLLRDLFAEGALSSAFVPTFIRYMTDKGEAEAWLLANRVINALVVVLAGITLLFYFGASWFVYLLAAPFASIPGKFELTVQMTRIMSPFLLCVALAAAVMGMLNASGRFFVPALAPSAFNVCAILGGIFLREPLQQVGIAPVVSMAIGALVGGASQLFVQVPSAYRIGFHYRLILDFKDPGVRQIAMLMLPAIVGLSATQINIAVDTQLAGHYGNGPVSYLNYAFRLMQLPIGLFGVAIATTTLATVSLHAARNDIERLRNTVSSSLRLAACLTFPATAGLILFRREVIELLYERGAFLPSDTVKTSQVLFLYALALFAYSGVKILVPTFYALNDTKTPVRLSVTTVAVKIAVNFLLIIPMGFLGLAMATAVASWLNFALLCRSFLKRTGAHWGLSELVAYMRIAAASIVMGLVALLAFHACRQGLPMHGTWGLILHLGTAIAVAMITILPLLRLFKVEEERDLSAIVVRLAGKLL
ncbi:MAG: murein biosynthesis integral membrane protein MurJ [Acidobacteriia bacterium]|nr:murein biosynthesis integral membrane protein MurJ [Terriglobia bacterium]